jgi:hypothetical protein
MAFWAHMNLPTGSSLKRIAKTDAVCRSCEGRRGHPDEGKDRKVTVREHHRPASDACARNLIRTSAPCNKLAPIKSGARKMAEADLDAVIRSIAKTQNKVLMDAARKRRDRLIALSAKAKDKETRQHYKQAAKATLQLAAAAARRMQVTAENAADSYARSVKKEAEQSHAGKPVKDKPVKAKPAKKKKG